MQNTERFLTLLKYLHSNENAVYKLIFDESEILAYYDTDFESDNGLDEDEDGYEEYQCIAFKKVNDGTLFEVNYHNLPTEVIRGKIQII